MKDIDIGIYNTLEFDKMFFSSLSKSIKNVNTTSFYLCVDLVYTKEGKCILIVYHKNQKEYVL